MSFSSGSGAFIETGDLTSQVLVADFSRVEMLFDAVPNLVAEGALRRGIEVELPGNALVERFEIIVTARPAIAARAVDVAQTRIGGEVGAEGEINLIIDFGAPRTVAMVRPSEGFSVTKVHGWDGMRFSIDAHPTNAGASGRTAVLGETRSERLQVTVSGNGSKEELVADTLVVLPDAPSDLELRIDDGPPVWRHSGTVRLEPSNDLTADGFNRAGKRVVDLTSALAALTGNPTAPGPRRFRLELSSRTAGVLDLEAPANRRLLRRVWRATAGGEAEPRLAFAEEGAQSVALAAQDMPPEATVTQLRATLKGTVPPERTLPPVGPAASDAVEVTMDADRAAIVRLPTDPRLASLIAVRLPLTPGAGGAELTVALWSSTEAGEPATPIPTSVARPVALDDGGERWVSFLFDQPQVLPPAPAPARPVWAAILVSRGRVVWRLTPAADLSHEDGSLRTGPAAGPWYPLPALFDRVVGNQFGVLRGRVRVTGLPAKATPIAPIKLDAAASPLDVTPSDAGVRAVVPVAAGRTLTMTALAATTVTLSEIDLVTAG